MNATWVGGAVSRIPFKRLITVAVARGGITAANLGVFALLGQIYGVETVGLFASYLAFVALFGSLVGAGLPEMLMRRVAVAGPLRRNSLRILRTPYWAASFALIITSGVPGYGLLRLLEALLKADLPQIAAFGPGAYVFGLLVSEEYRGRGRAEAALFSVNFGTILAPLAGVLFSISSVGREAPILPILVWVQVVASTGLGLGYAMISGVGFKRLARCQRVWRKLKWPDLASMACIRVLSAGAGHIAVLITGAVATPALAGFVAISTRLAGLAATYTGIINAAFARRIGSASKSRSKSIQLFFKTSVMSALGVSVLMAPILAFPSTFLGIFGVNSAISGAALGLQVLVLSRVLRAVAGISDLFLLVSGRSYIELFAGASGIAVLAASLLLLPTGAVTVAISLSLSTVAHGAISAAAALRYSGRYGTT